MERGGEGLDLRELSGLQRNVGDGGGLRWKVFEFDLTETWR